MFLPHYQKVLFLSTNQSGSIEGRNRRESTGSGSVGVAAGPPRSPSTENSIAASPGQEPDVPARFQKAAQVLSPQYEK